MTLWTRLVVVSELPVERSTLPLRLLGAGRVLKQAIGELSALPEDAPERTLALPVLLRLRLEVPANPAARSFPWAWEPRASLRASLVDGRGTK